MKVLKHAGATDASGTGTTKVVSSGPELTWVSPAQGEVFKISQEAELPEVIFEVQTSHASDCHWSWCIEWEARSSGLRERARKGAMLRKFCETGTVKTSSNKWTLDFAGKVLGGKLTVTVKAGKQTLVRTVTIEGQNPTLEQVSTYMGGLEGLESFDKLLAQETQSKHFIELDGHPVVSFDQGYGITQMTNPAPSYEQVWDWKANILGGATVYREKMADARRHLGKGDRAYTDEQLLRETFSRYNGGFYHEWDAGAETWVRRKNLLCDTVAGNIGWDTGKQKNEGKTESELRERDKETYQKGREGQTEEHVWSYTGVCYADHVLGE